MIEEQFLKTELSGNLAKLKIILDLTDYIRDKKDITIIDVGCGNVSLFDFWYYILNNYNDKFRLYCIDISNLEEAKAICARDGWQNVYLKKVNGYRLSEIFGNNYFDVLVSTQVLEHIKHTERFLSELKSITKGNGLIYFTLDSAHYSRKSSLKDFIKNKLAFIGIEKFYLSPLYDDRLEELFKKLNLVILDKKFYNIHPLKEIHNHRVSKNKKNNLLLKWFEYEEFLNNDKDFIKENKNYFMELYYKLQRK